MQKMISFLFVIVVSSSSALAQDFCKGDFDYNGAVDADDVTTFLTHFGRSPFFNPCPPDGSVPAPKTGQTTCWRREAPWDAINCAGTGQDGEHQKGIVWPDPRFTDNGNGTVTDNLTGLMWTKDAMELGWFYSPSEATTACNDLDFAGYTDWRLPNVRELLSLIDYEEHNPALPLGHPFYDVQISYYMSSTTNDDKTWSSWYVIISTGEVGYLAYDEAGYAWPVRGGQ